MQLLRALRNSCIFLCLASTSALAQYTLNKIVFRGDISPYQQVTLESATGLKAGDQLTQEVMQQAAQRLSDTGAFGDLQVTLDGPIKSVTIVFTITPLDSSHRLAVTFDNFVWFTHEELETELRSRIPLFAPLLPEAGNLQDTVQTVLSDILRKKGITATVTHTTYDPNADHPTRIVAYRVQSPAINLHSINLTGVAPEFTATMNDLKIKMVGTPFTDGFEKPTTDELLLSPYLKAGYLKAHLVNRTLTLASPSPDHVEVNLSGTIDAGTPFRVGNIIWAGSSEMSSADFITACPMRTGNLAESSALAKCIDLLAASYRKKGYADVIVSSAKSVDASANSVSYTLSVTPGDMYHIRTLTTINLTPAQQADFNRGWTLKAGDIFDSEYITNFLTQNTALRSFEGYSASFKATRDSESHLVDVIVTFARTSEHKAN
jgi:outer membrane protein insertion porin family